MKKAVLFSMAVCVFMLCVYVRADVSGDYEYTDNGGGTCTLTGYTGPGGDITLPDTLGGLTVTVIGDSAFLYNDTLTGVVIPDSVIVIGDDAFEACLGLISVTIPNGVTAIGNWAFNSCYNLTSVTVPDSVTSIGNDAFNNCNALTDITVDLNNPAYSSQEGVLFNKDQTVIIQCPGGKTGGYSIPGSVVTIEDRAFEGCSNLTGVIIPDSVIAIGNWAFVSCYNLTGVIIPGSVTTIGDRAFGWCHELMNITVDLNNPAYSSLEGVLFNKDQTVLIEYPGGKAGGYSIPGSVVTIEDGAFAFCYDLNSVTIGNSVTTIGSMAFQDCIGLTNVTIGNSVTTIGDWAFQNCTSLTAIYFKGNAPILGTSVFLDVNATVYYLQGTTGWGSIFGGLPTALWDDQYAWTDNGDGTCTLTGYTGPGGDVTIPGTLNGLTVTDLGSYAFSDDTNLISVVIPDSVTSIGWYVFRYCSNLISIDIGNSVASIANGAFYGCTGLTSIHIPGSVTTLNTVAFYGCSGLQAITVDALNPVYSSLDGVLFNKTQTELIQYPDAKTGAYIIPDGVVTIGSLAFEGSIGLTDVTIGIDVAIIENDAFRGCFSLLDIMVDALNPSYSSLEGVLFNKSQTELLQCPGGKAGSYSIPNGVTSLDYNSFFDCISLTCVIFPDSVDVILSGAFSGCTGLTCLYFKGNAPSLIQGTFTNVDNATVYYLSAYVATWPATFGGLPTELWPTSVADVDVNGDVNFGDFVAFAAAWQAEDGVDAEYNLLCDISDPVDGVIDAADLAVFADEWLITPCR